MRQKGSHVSLPTDEELDRFWVLDNPTEIPTAADNRQHEVAEAAELPLVCIVDEAGGGVMGYWIASQADDIVKVLNRIPELVKEPK
jgi:hypothetical protein